MIIRNKIFRKPKIERKVELQIIEFWKKSKVNTIKAISEEFKITQSIVNRVIDDYINGRN